MRTFALKLLSVMLFAGSLAAHAADVSLISGVYQKESSKIEGATAGSTSTFGGRGRFHDDLGESLAWYGEGGLEAQSYSAPNGRKSPSNVFNVEIGGGVRHYFKPFATAVVPYASAGASVRNMKAVDWRTSGYQEITTNGLYYNAAVGVRAGLDSNFFVELELPLFDRALFAVAKKVTVVDGPPSSEAKEEVTYNELWVGSSAKLTDARVAVGYKF